MLGTLGILYFAISRAYQTYYYDPLIKEYQVKTVELNKKKENAETSLSSITSAKNLIDTQIVLLEKTEIPAIHKEIDLQKEKIKSMDESIIDKYNPFNDRDETVTQAYEEKNNAISRKKNLYLELEALQDRKAIKSEKESEIRENLNKIDIMISVQENEKEKAKKGALGVFSWVLSILW